MGAASTNMITLRILCVYTYSIKSQGSCAAMQMILPDGTLWLQGLVEGYSIAYPYGSLDRSPDRKKRSEPEPHLDN